MAAPKSDVFEFDVALSFAGEDRAYVHEVAKRLRQQGVRVFYDEFLTADLWGRDLYALLDEVYRKKARFVIAFISRHYVNKPWTTHERQSAQARSHVELGPYFLPVRLDDSEVPGLRPTVGYIDARRTSPAQLAGYIQQKLARGPGVTVERAIFAGIPRTAEQKRRLLAERPLGWEYLLYAGTLLQRKEALEFKWYNYQIGYTGHATLFLRDDFDASQFYSDAFAAIIGLESDGNKLFAPGAKQLAFGRPGELGDPTRIEQLASSLMGVYEGYLDWSARIGAVRPPEHWVRLFELSRRLLDKPLRDIREFVARYVAEAERIPERTARGEQVRLEPSLKIEADDKAVDEYRKEALQLRQRPGLGE